MTAAIEIIDVTKKFRLYQEKMQSAKERIIKFGRVPYEDFYALRNVTFEVAEGTTTGLLGHNGSGKSTLLKCVAGTMRPTEGIIRTRGRVAALLELGAGFHGDLTGRENLYLNGSILGFSKADVDRIFDKVVDFAEIAPFIDMQVKHYSSGMTARLGFALAIHVDPDIVLVDEVLSVGDEAFQRKCLERVSEMQAEGRTILVVTHAADMLRQICQHGVVLDRGELIADDEPGPAIRAFRDSLIRRGLAFAEGIEDPDAEQVAERRLTKKVRFTEVAIEYPGGLPHIEPGQPLGIRCGYEAPERVDDIVFAINIFDPSGNLILGTNSDINGEDIDYVEGAGDVTFAFSSVPLLDGDYEFQVGMHAHEGEEYDHFEGDEHIQVMNPGRAIGRVAFPLHFDHRRG
ncbi:MAG: ABC transporter ATP-binding protein [Actinobacteria bacterium]|nr:ABC transporter ATP-binding protein [Actinomycetota bacterium]